MYSLEEAFWRGLKDIAATRRVSLSDLVGSIDTERQHGNLSSAIRLFVLNHYQTRMAPVVADVQNAAREHSSEAIETLARMHIVPKKFRKHARLGP